MAHLHWLDILIAPLTWLARARGRRRLALLGLYGLILGGAGVFVGREVVLWQLPDSPEPFDLAKFGHVDLLEADNAMKLYGAAARRLPRGANGQAIPPRGGWNQWNWSGASSEVRAWAAENQPALGVWLEATRRRDALQVQPAEFTHSTVLLDGELQLLTQLGMLAATRRQANNDLAGAWIYHRGVIRCCLHTGRHAGVRLADASATLLGQAIPQVVAWVDAPGQTADLLRQARGDLADCQGLRTTSLDVIRAEYFAARAQFDDPWAQEDREVDPSHPRNWQNHFPGFLALRSFLRNEPERSRRILRLITSGLLAQSTRPVADRPRLVVPGLMIYAIDAATPPALARITPQSLAAWAEVSACHGLLAELDFFLGRIQAGQNQLDELRLLVAERSYELDHAGQQAPTYGALVPAYLDTLPAGSVADDPLIRVRSTPRASSF